MDAYERHLLAQADPAPDTCEDCGRELEGTDLTAPRPACERCREWDDPGDEE